MIHAIQNQSQLTWSLAFNLLQASPHLLSAYRDGVIKMLHIGFAPLGEWKI